MEGKKLLSLVYDILANNPVPDEDRQRVTEYINYIDYDHSKIVFGNDMDLRLYDHEEELSGVFDMTETEFKEALARRTSPKSIFEHAADIYEYLMEVFDQDCNDSLLREWAFQWYCEKTGDNYDNIYDKWLEG